jgi:uncharacterized membrane protein
VLAFGFIVGVSLGIALTFGIVFGAWLMLPFAAAELVVLYLAFRHLDAHAGDYESVEIRGNHVEVKVVEGEAVRRYEFNRHWARVICARDGSRVALRSHGRELEIGRHLCEERRAAMASELERELHAVR